MDSGRNANNPLTQGHRCIRISREKIVHKKEDNKIHTWCLPSQCIPIACGTIQYVPIKFTNNKPGIPIYDNRLRHTYFLLSPWATTGIQPVKTKSALRPEHETDHLPTVSGKVYNLYFLILFPIDLPSREPCRRDKVAVWTCTKCKEQQRNAKTVYVSMCIPQSYSKDSQKKKKSVAYYWCVRKCCWATESTGPVEPMILSFD